MSELTRSINSSLTFEDGDRLVVRLKEGDRAAFDEAFHLYRDMVYTLSSKLLSDRGEALDITQEVFLTLFRKVHSFRGECSLKTWLYRVTVNQASNRNRWWKRRHRSRTLSLSIENEPGSNGTIPDLPSDHPSPARSLFSRELRDALQSGLSELPFEQRVAVALRDVEGLTYEEIANVTDSRIGTVKSRIARGRERLREVLDDYRGGTRQ